MSFYEPPLYHECMGFRFVGVLILTPLLIACGKGFNQSDVLNVGSAFQSSTDFVTTSAGQSPVGASAGQVNATLRAAIVALPTLTSANRPATPLIVPLIEKLFQDRQLQRSRIESWGAAFDKANQIEMHRYFQESRYREEMLLELLNANGTLGLNQVQAPAFTGGAGQRVFAAGLSESTVDFQSGDVLLERGTRNISATIARAGDSSSLMSHVLIVYIDSNQQKWAVESLAEDGVHVRPLSETLSHSVGRAVHLRAKDPALRALAAQAAASIAKTVTDAEKAGQPLIYDFAMNLSDHSQMFCSEVVYAAFEAASGGQVKLPMYSTSLNTESKSMTDKFGINQATVFSPADLEIDPRFEILQEWREPRLTAKLRYQERVLDQINHEMTVQGLTLKPDATVNFIVGLVSTDRQLAAQVGALVGVTMPPGINPQTVGTIYMVDRSIDGVFSQLSSTMASQIATAGFPVATDQIDSAIQAIFQKTPGKIGYLSR